jgi:hypothetical protein
MEIFKMKIIVCFRPLQCICSICFANSAAASLLILVRLGAVSGWRDAPGNMELISPTVLDQAYLNLRRGFDRVALIESQLAECVRRCQSLGEFWSFIKAKHGTYQARREYIGDFFRPLLEYLKAQSRSPGVEPTKNARPETSGPCLKLLRQRALFGKRYANTYSTALEVQYPVDSGLSSNVV